MPYGQENILVTDQPPAYDSLISPSQLYAEENTLLKEENTLLGIENERLKTTNSQLIVANSLLTEQIQLINSQLKLTKETTQRQDSMFAVLKEHNKLLQIKNEALTELFSLTEGEQTSSYTEEALKPYAALQDIPEIQSLHDKMKELETNLQEQKENLTEIDRQVQEKTQIIQESLIALLEGDTFAQIVHGLEAKISANLHQDQGILYDELAGRSSHQNELTQAYLDSKTEKLTALNRINSNQKTQLFYNTSYSVLWAKIIGFTSLCSELVEKKAGAADKALELGSSMLGGLLGGIPIIGSLVETITAFTVKEAGGAIMGRFEEPKNQNMLGILQNPEQAKKMAELFARSLTLRYQKDIQGWELKKIKAVATLYSNQLYGLCLSGKIKGCEDYPIENKVAIFLDALKTPSSKEIAEKERLISLPLPFSVPVSASPASLRTKPNIAEKSWSTTVYNSTKTLRSLVSKHEFSAEHARILLQGVERQHSDLQQQSVQQQGKITQIENRNNKQDRAINNLNGQVTELKKNQKNQEEMISTLQEQITKALELVANLFAPPPSDPLLTATKPTNEPKEKPNFFSRMKDMGAPKIHKSHTPSPPTGNNRLTKSS
ncbi:MULTISPECIES: hypothetical protein [unclassified Legionella]|uniref:hypothetical protein n=1 Tax=unclassified Legionella TaxID=2622702 RepID=UPI0010547E87|nr:MULTISPECIES: hypothetical protein [unclassified Legionella]MDI9819101.1 hypothetical protein [Legionella sp. PL877]